MKTTIKENIQFLGLNFKKEILFVCLINICMLAILLPLIYFHVNFYFYIVYGMIFVVVDYLLISRYGDMKKQLIIARDNEFIEMISYFQIYISNNQNVYQSFLMILPYCSDWLRNNVEQMLAEIDANKSVQPYVNFARKFSLLIVESVMISIYQMVDEGGGTNRLNEFNALYTQISNNHNLEKIEIRARKLDIVSAFPLLGAALITVALTFSIIGVVGAMSNVI